jgi:hypothetical protein
MPGFFFNGLFLKTDFFVAWNALSIVLKKKAAPCGTAKFREETSKKQRAEAAPRPKATDIGRYVQEVFCIAASSPWRNRVWVNLLISLSSH